MKVIKLLAKSLLLCFLISSCSRGEETVDELSVPKNGEVLTANQFLSDRYGSYESVESLVLVVEDEELNLEKISIDGESQLDTYVVSSVNTNGLLYFVELNWDTKTLESKDFYWNEQELASINPNESELIQGEDLMLMSQQENAANSLKPKKDRNKFWGWTCGPIADLNDNKPFRTCCYRILGLVNHCEDRGVGDLPGTNPRIVSIQQ